MQEHNCVAIAGIGGAGKTSLATALANCLGAAVLYWDDFDAISIAPDDYVQWYETDKDYKRWDYSSLAEILKNFKNGKNSLHPITNQLIMPQEWMIIDAPLGRMHQQTSQYFDWVFYLDTPLDIALARRVLRSHDNLQQELMHYITHARKVFADSSVKDSSDFIIDGTRDLGYQMELILQRIKDGRTLSV